MATVAAAVAGRSCSGRAQRRLAGIWGMLGRLTARGVLSPSEAAHRAQEAAEVAGSAGSFSVGVQQEAFVRTLGQALSLAYHAKHASMLPAPEGRARAATWKARKLVSVDELGDAKRAHSAAASARHRFGGLPHVPEEELTASFLDVKGRLESVVAVAPAVCCPPCIEGLDEGFEAPVLPLLEQPVPLVEQEGGQILTGAQLPCITLPADFVDAVFVHADVEPQPIDERLGAFTRILPPGLDVMPVLSGAVAAADLAAFRLDSVACTRSVTAVVMEHFECEMLVDSEWFDEVVLDAAIDAVKTLVRDLLGTRAQGEDHEAAAESRL